MKNRIENGEWASRWVPGPIFHSPFSILRCSGFSRFLASYSAPDFESLSTVVHTAFQRELRESSRWWIKHLAQSPHRSTCAIHMNDNNLRMMVLLRTSAVISTFTPPRERRAVASHLPERSPTQPHSRRASHSLPSTERRARPGTTLRALREQRERKLGRILVRGALLHASYAAGRDRALVHHR